MNHLFQGITWLRYAELLAFALIIYYLYVGLRYYRADIAKLLRPSRRPLASAQQEHQLPQASDMEYPDAVLASVHRREDPRGESPTEAEALTTALLASIAESSGRAYEPALTAQKLKTILLGYPGLRRSPQRGQINRLIVAECKKTGIGQLSEEVVDQWWWDD